MARGSGTPEGPWRPLPKGPSRTKNTTESEYRHIRKYYLPCPSFPWLFFIFPWFFRSLEFPWFFEGFPILFQGFEGSARAENPWYFWSFPWPSPKTKKDRVSNSKTFQDGNGNGNFGEINSDDFEDGNLEAMEMKGSLRRKFGTDVTERYGEGSEMHAFLGKRGRKTAHRK